MAPHVPVRRVGCVVRLGSMLPNVALKLLTRSRDRRPAAVNLGRRIAKCSAVVISSRIPVACYSSTGRTETPIPGAKAGRVGGVAFRSESHRSQCVHGMAYMYRYRKRQEPVSATAHAWARKHIETESSADQRSKLWDAVVRY